MKEIKDMEEISTFDEVEQPLLRAYNRLLALENNMQVSNGTKEERVIAAVSFMESNFNRQDITTMSVINLAIHKFGKDNTLMWIRSMEDFGEDYDKAVNTVDYVDE